ncbi:MAG: molybdopterin biosynthesis protein, partial [Ruminococcaceae bacterium]|nr:molybdopterin biosynthesis protein [Oscillospiraceae bacterium]
MPQEYLVNTPLAEAVRLYLDRLNSAGVKPVVERIQIKDSRGRRIAAAVYARRSVPHYLASAMDGIALQAEWTFGASETAPVEIHRDKVIPVDTGDCLPEEMDAVIMIEDVIEHGEQIRLISPAVPWQHVRQIGEDFCAGDMLVSSGTILTPALMGILAAGGVSEIEVFRQPRI